MILSQIACDCHRHEVSNIIVTNSLDFLVTSSIYSSIFNFKYKSKRGQPSYDWPYRLSHSYLDTKCQFPYYLPDNVNFEHLAGKWHQDCKWAQSKFNGKMVYFSFCRIGKIFSVDRLDHF